MNVLFISIAMPDMASNQGGYYADLLRGATNLKHRITILAPSIADGFVGIRDEGIFRVVRVSTGDFIGNYSFLKKGVNVLRLSYQYKRAIWKYLREDDFDIVIMPTPPVTLANVVSYVKKKYGAKLYLILRDIHPECLDRKVIPQRFYERNDVYEECKKPYGVSWFTFQLLYRNSQILYRISDYIGCMSPGNMSFMKEIAPKVPEERIVLLPNWYKGIEMRKEDRGIRETYELGNKFVAIFGGTIGEAQAVWNIAQLAKMNLDKQDAVFLIVGRGVRKRVLEEIAKQDHLSNMLFLDYMPREDYEAILQTADLGLISIDEKYKVPTCPSKIIGYMALAKPVLAMFNKDNDFGEFYINKSGCGLWSVDLDYQKAQENFEWFYYHREEGKAMGLSGYRYYNQHFTTERVGRQLFEQLKRLVEDN